VLFLRTSRRERKTQESPEHSSVRFYRKSDCHRSVGWGFFAYPREDRGNVLRDGPELPARGVTLDVRLAEPRIGGESGDDWSAGQAG
jgi:hypothetical protein